MGQAGYPPHPIKRRAGAVAMAAPVIISGAEPTDEDAVLLVQGATASIAVRATEPWPSPLPASGTEGPLLLELDDLRLAVEGDGDRGST